MLFRSGNRNRSSHRQKVIATVFCALLSVLPHSMCQVPTESSRPPVLYSGHKESGLIRISLSIGLGGPGWARGLYMDRKRQRGPARPPCLKRMSCRRRQNGICPCSPLPDAHLASGLLSIQCRTVEQAELSRNLFRERGRHWEAHRPERFLDHTAHVLRGTPCVQHDPAGD